MSEEANSKRPRDSDVEEASEKKSKVEVSSSLDEAAQNAIAKLLAFYFSDSNLRNDKFLKNEQSKDNGFVKISVLLTFNKLKAITTDVEAVVSVVKTHASLKDFLQVSDNGSSLKRTKELAANDDSPLRTVYVSGFSEDNEPEIAAMIELFSKFGEVLLVRKRRGGNVRRDMPKKFLGSLFVEFKDQASAQSAATQGDIETKASPKSSDEDASSTQTIALKIIMLNEWLEQNKQAKEAEMKARREQGEPGNENGEEANEEESGPAADPVYDAGKILKLSGIPKEFSIDRFAFKDYFAKYGKVKYVDFTDGNSECFIRFDTPEEARGALDDIKATSADGVVSLKAIKAAMKNAAEKTEEAAEEVDSFFPISLVEGDEEKEIWRSIDVMHKQNMSSNGNRGKGKKGKGGKGGKGKGKGKGKRSRD